MADRVRSLEETLVQARTEAATDALTGLTNRGAFDRALASWIDAAATSGTTFALALVDIDDFKTVNDTHGHPVGDRVLVSAARILTGGVRSKDVVSRYGGDEFAVMLEQMTAAQARQRLSALLESMAPSYAYEQNGVTGAVTFSLSVGVTDVHPGDTPEAMVKRADEALYAAKRKGKKRVEMRVASLLRRLVG
jgi:diguanylate cyclase (GGDEF)-like protein